MKSNYKKTISLIALALAVTSLAPAQASNKNDKALNLMAMQMYMQNQANNAAAAAASAQTPYVAQSYGYNPNLIPANYAYNPGIYTPAYNGCNNLSYNNNNNNINIAPQMNHLTQEAAKINARLAAGNLPGWEVTRLQNKLAKIQTEENTLVATGNPYGTGWFNNVRGYLGI